MKIFLFILAFTNFIQIPLLAQKPYELSARAFRKSPADNGFRRRISEISSDTRYAFYRFLEIYYDESDRNDQMKVMKDYYESFSEDHFRIVALMFMYNSYDPMDQRSEKLMIRFINNHLYEENVLGLFLYRYGTLPFDPPLSFKKLYTKLKRRVRDFSFPDLESILFMDLMISQEMYIENQRLVQDLLAKMWQNEIRKNTILYQEHRDLFRRVVSFYRLRQRHQNFIPTTHSEFRTSRIRFFERYGYSSENIIANLESNFKVDQKVFKMPDFLPQMLKHLSQR